MNDPALLPSIAHIRERRPELIDHATVSLDTWLEQFDSAADRALALRMLEEMRFFSLSEMRHGLRQLHAWLLAHAGVDLRRTRFTSFAEGKSGGLIQYFYRTSNWVHHSLGLDWSDLGNRAPVKGEEPDTLVIMDDTIGTGREAIWYFQEARELLARWPRKYFLALVGFREGLEALLAATPEVEVKCFEEHEKLLDPRHPRFTEEEKSALAEMLPRYGDRVYPIERYGSIASPFGYRDGQALLAYFYNTPSNTVPIFWSVENGWRPLFQRFDSYNVPQP